MIIKKKDMDYKLRLNQLESNIRTRQHKSVMERRSVLKRECEKKELEITSKMNLINEIENMYGVKLEDNPQRYDGPAATYSDKMKVMHWGQDWSSARTAHKEIISSENALCSMYKELLKPCECGCETPTQLEKANTNLKETRKLLRNMGY